MSLNWMDLIVVALKFLLGMFWHRSSVPSEAFFPIACDIWMVLCLYWFFSALRMKAVLGTALVVGEVRGLLAVVILCLGFYRKARREEAILTREFGAGFEAHVQHTGMFLPRV